VAGAQPGDRLVVAMPHEQNGHSHTHPHGEHSHAPQPGGEDYAARRHPEFVALDIGGDVGALIVHTDPDMHGIEIEISPAGEDDRRTHKQVLERKLNERPAFTAVFDGLHTGRYTLWVDDEPRARDVAIEGSSIAELDWRT
jgi:hypothetical protein